MLAISAADAITLALERTRQFLFSPFRWRTYLKLGLVAILTEGLGGNFHGSKQGGFKPGQAPNFHAPGNFPDLGAHIPQLIAIVAVVALIIIVVSFVIAYLITRLRFAYFHCLIHNITEIRPGWRLYREPATRFFWLSVVVGFSFLLMMILSALPFISGFVNLYHQSRAMGHPDYAVLISLILALVPVILLLVLIAYLIHIVLRDWMLPHYALEDASALEAWLDVWDRITAEKGQFALYALLRLLLPMVAAIGLFIVLLLPGLLLAGSVAGLEFMIHSAFANATGGILPVGIFLMAIVGLVGFVIAALAAICIGGPLSTAVREYAISFYAGRYQKLGDILYPPPAIAEGEPIL
jgi:hypothetical protein